MILFNLFSDFPEARFDEDRSCEGSNGISSRPSLEKTVFNIITRRRRRDITRLEIITAVFWRNSVGLGKNLQLPCTS